ncbi:putative folate-biopterin transporter 7 [Dorcoceras hygrometricum]|uniref:Putative folate-biopterin transporter 7 n=1 Tax=Dorcoceras hygrometricum TaxID=472368 RepID=A0A2Z7BDB6_9LAMI|nr:putative folate-biopterin transporter 7 [Dorcoceras hygrometricum]
MESSVRDIPGPSAHHSSVVFRYDNTVDHHSDDSVGPFRTTQQSAGHNLALNQILQRYGTTTEANQLPSATAITTETPWNSNLYQVSNNQINSNSTSKVLRSSSIIQLPNPIEYSSAPKQSLNLARNHLPKNAQHPKNAIPDFSRILRTPAASRSNPQVFLQPLMGSNRKS